MAWTTISTGLVRKIRYHERRQKIDVVYNDGRVGRGPISAKVYQEFMASKQQDKETYFRNYIAHDLVVRSGAILSLRQFALIALYVASVALLIYALFSISEYVRFS